MPSFFNDLGTASLRISSDFSRPVCQVDFDNPHIDPTSRKECIPFRIGKEVVDTCVKEAAIEICGFFLPPPNNCIKDITLHLASLLRITDERRSTMTCSFKRLGLEMDARGRELYKNVASEVMNRGMNMSPFARVDNGMVSFDSWSKGTVSVQAAIDTFAKIKDPDARGWNEDDWEDMDEDEDMDGGGSDDKDEDSDSDDSDDKCGNKPTKRENIFKDI
jgi:hypothetical protein